MQGRRARNLRATRVLDTVKLSLRIPNTMIREQPPVWLGALTRYPPTDILARPAPTVHADAEDSAEDSAHSSHPRQRQRQRRPRRTFIPHPLVFPEDALRRTFFMDHPWELARPRIAVELDGQDARYVDWSRGLRQPGWIVSGESVVQRQLWLMENGQPQYAVNQATGTMEITHRVPLSKAQAYDIARKELYDIRQQEAIERRIVAEEARMVGAYFGKSRLQVGFELESKAYDKWRLWAEAESEKIATRRASAYTNFSSAEDEAVAADLAALQKAGEDMPEATGQT